MSQTRSETLESTPSEPCHLDQPDNRTRDLHVKGVPESIWRRARCNATNSGMTFKDYMIALLASSSPFGQ